MTAGNNYSSPYFIINQKNVWILDTRGTNHVSHYINMFTHMHDITSIHIRLHNRAFITTHFSRTIYSRKNFYLLDVLYIPSYYTNLILVPKLTKSLDCHINFNSTTYLIPVNHTLMKIDAVDLHDELYILKNASFLNNFMIDSSCNFHQNEINSKLNVPIIFRGRTLIWFCRLSYHFRLVYYCLLSLFYDRTSLNQVLNQFVLIMQNSIVIWCFLKTIHIVYSS